LVRSNCPIRSAIGAAKDLKSGEAHVDPACDSRHHRHPADDDRLPRLRSNPRESDRWSPGRRRHAFPRIHFLGVAVFGNVIGRYPPGARVTVLGESALE
jgi:hypothetical protein